MSSLRINGCLGAENTAQLISSRPFVLTCTKLLFLDSKEFFDRAKSGLQKRSNLQLVALKMNNSIVVRYYKKQSSLYLCPSNPNIRVSFGAINVSHVEAMSESSSMYRPPNV